MSYFTRKDILAKIEKCRKKPAITYINSIRPAISSQIAPDSINYIIRQIELIPKDQKEVDLILVSNGGDPITALRIISILRERFSKISVLVPYVAYSAATILSLGADEILMHPYSNLGPVDPQLTFSRSLDNGSSKQIRFSSEDIRNYIDFVKNDIGITDQTQLATAFNALTQDVGAIHVGSAKRSQQLLISASIKMLQTHMKDSNKATEIANKLNSSFYHHGYAVGRSEAKKLGLKIIYPKQQLESLMWELWQDYSEEMKCNSIFDIASILLGDKDVAKWFNDLPLIDFSSSLPPDVAQQVINMVAQKYFTITRRPPLERKELIASIESTREAYATYVNIKISYWRDINMSLGFNTTSYSDGWEKYNGV